MAQTAAMSASYVYSPTGANTASVNQARASSTKGESASFPRREMKPE